MSETKTENLNVSIRGIALYPKMEDGVMRYALMLSEETAGKLHKVVYEKFKKDLVFGEDEESNACLLNVKSQYEVPVFDYETQEALEDKNIYHGAEVVANVIIKEYTYKKKTGVTAYLKAFALIKQGKAKEVTSFKSIMENVL